MFRNHYSAFDAEDDAGEALSSVLPRLGIKRIYIGGLATDYCVLNTTLDLLRAGYQVIVLTDACRAVNVAPDDGIKAIETMLSHGAVTMTTAAVEQ
ncbi:isochorismatase family protein [Thiohalocapsa marina]|uniref:nicotinamidase n=1 Tax=Thiohalocapsa marina TaxID=424902 RepID=A0A5M8FRV4_9GAMM|nr:isochorismatase family protein [Thiohalocapsa marina]KAA6184222.1 isochorismatase family protein [Thiohalocapsa marina]